MRNTYRDYFITKHGAETYNMLIQDTKDKYGYVSTDYAEEEVVCDSLVALQKKKGFAEDMAKTLYENGYSKNKIKKFFRTVADFFRKMANMVRSLFDSETVTQAGVYAERDAAFLDKLSDSFFAGMRKVAEYNFEGVDGETRKMKPTGKHNVFGFELYNNANVNYDLLEELSIYHPEAKVKPNGNIIVYHRTSEENANIIKSTGIMTAKEDALFFSSKESGYADGYGDTVLTFSIPSTVLEVNDIFDGEVHFDIPLKMKNGKFSLNVSKYILNDDKIKLENEVQSFGISEIRDVKDVQKNVFNTLKSENFFKQFDTSGRIFRVDVNEESGILIETNKSGIEETFNADNFAILSVKKKLYKLKLIRMLPEIIRKGHIIKDNVKDIHGSKDVKFMYIEHNLIIEGENCTVKIDVKKSINKNKFWVHQVEIKESTKSTTSRAENTTHPVQIGFDAFTDSIHNNSDLSIENKKKMLPEEQAELDRLKSELERKDAELAESKIEHERYVRTAEKTIKAKERLIQTYSEALAIGAGGNVVSFESVKDIVRGLNERYDLRLSLSDDVSELTKIYSHIANAKNTNSSELLGEIRQFVEKRVIPASFKIDDSLRRQYKGFLRDVRLGVRLNENQVSELCHLTGLPWGKARDTAARMNLSAGERKNTRPDIDRSDVVFAGNIGESHSLSPTKIKKLKESLLSLNKKNIILNADGRLIKVTTDDYTIDKNIFSVKGRTNNEVNARIIAIPEFEQILLKSRYFETDTNVRNVDKKAKKALLV